MQTSTPTELGPRRIRTSELLGLGLVFVSALAARVYQLGLYSQYFLSTYGSDLFIDRLGETYHRWLMDILTIRNSGVYTDFIPMPNQAIVWPPFFNYLSLAAMYLLNNYSILVPRLISLVAGSLTSVVVFRICLRLYSSLWPALVGGLILAFLPWSTDYSTLGVPHTLGALLVALTVYYYLENRLRAFGLTSALAMLTNYEAWPIVLLLVAIGYSYRGWDRKKQIFPLVAFLTVIIGWSLWSLVQAGNPVAWVARYLDAIGWRPTFDPAVLLFYVNEALRSTFFIFFIGLVFGLYHNWDTRVIATITIVFTLLASFAHAAAFDRGDLVRLIFIYPLIAILFPPALPKLRGGIPRKVILAGVLLLLLVLPNLAIVDPGWKKAYILMPEYRAGLRLRELYQGGMVLSDSAAAIYYSQIDPEMFVSFDALYWYRTSPSQEKLSAWIAENHITFIMWINSTFSKSWVLFPELRDAKLHVVGELRFSPAYDDTLRKRLEIERQGGTELWEHKFPGTPDVILYQVEARSQSSMAGMVTQQIPMFQVGGQSQVATSPKSLFSGGRFHANRPIGAS